jgi:hypothetical protein
MNGNQITNAKNVMECPLLEDLQMSENQLNSFQDIKLPCLQVRHIKIMSLTDQDIKAK